MTPPPPPFLLRGAWPRMSWVWIQRSLNVCQIITLIYNLTILNEFGFVPKRHFRLSTFDLKQLKSPPITSDSHSKSFKVPNIWSKKSGMPSFGAYKLTKVSCFPMLQAIRNFLILDFSNYFQGLQSFFQGLGIRKCVCLCVCVWRVGGGGGVE